MEDRSEVLVVRAEPHLTPIKDGRGYSYAVVNVLADGRRLIQFKFRRLLRDAKAEYAKLPEVTPNGPGYKMYASFKGDRHIGYTHRMSTAALLDATVGH